MTKNRRCGDILKTGFLTKLNRLFDNGIVKTFIIAAVIGTVTYFSTSLVNMPKDFTSKADFTSLAQSHKDDFKLLDDKKLDRSEYIRAHDILLANIDFKFNTLLSQMKQSQQAVNKLTEMHMSNKSAKTDK